MHSLLRGGAEHVFAQLISELSAKYEIHVFLLHNGITYTLPDNVKVLGLNEKLFEKSLLSYLRIPFIASRIYRYCKKNDIWLRVSVLNRPSFVNTFLKLFFRMRGKSIVCERTNPSKLIEMTVKGNFFLKSLMVTTMRTVYNNADAVLVNSKLTGSEIINEFQCHSEVSVIYNPVNIERITKLSAEQPDFNFEQDCKYIIGVGVFRKEKNWNMLIEAMTLVRNEKIKLVLVGYGNSSEELKLQDLVKLKKLEHRVVFAGMQYNPYQFIKRSYALVLCSILEGFPNVILESLAIGTPVISTDCRSGPREILAPSTDPATEVVDHVELAEYGILCPVNDEKLLAEAIVTLCSDEKLHNNYSEKSKIRAKDFELEKITREYDSVFSNFLHK